MVLNISPISDPEDIRREAGIASPPPAQQNADTPSVQPVSQQSEPIAPIAPAIQPVQEQTEPQAETPAPSPGPNSFHMDDTPAATTEPEAAIADAQDPIAAPESVLSAPVVSSPSIYPDPQALKVQKQEQASFVEAQSAGSFVYTLPVGVYIIASFAIALSLFFWVYVLILGARTASFIIPALAATIIATLLSGKDIVRWISVAATAAGTIYYGYFFVKAVSGYMQMSSMTSYGFGGLSSYFLGIILLYGAAIASMAVACWYLLRPGVAKAFK